MARRNNIDGGIFLLALILAPFVVAAMAWDKFRSLPVDNQSSLILAAVALAILVFFFLIIRGRSKKKQRDQVFLKVSKITQNHISTLVVKRAQLVQKDAYGKFLYEKWYKHVDYFLYNHIATKMTVKENVILHKNISSITDKILEAVRSASDEDPAFVAFSDDMTPSDFETFCAEQLNQAGWVSRVTQRSRDQGVDVVAEKDGKKLVLQCKLYSKPVGNKAVQEISAGRLHEQAHFAAVVSNHKYTPQAEQLASTNGVLLLHYRELRRVDQVIANR